MFKSSKQIIYRRVGGCGSGKTHAALHEIASKPGYYIYAVEKRSLMVEIEAKLRDIASAMARPPTIVAIASDQKDAAGNAGTSPNCRADIEALPNIYEHNCLAGHVIAIVTHKSLLNVPSDDFENWHLIIDEVPSILSKVTLGTEASAAFLEQHFGLTPIENKHSSVVTLKSDLTRAELCRDDLMAPLLVFYDRVRSERTEVVVNLLDWKSVGMAHVKWSWFSIWDVAQLAGFASVQIMGNNLQNSVFARIVDAAGAVQWDDIDTPARPGFRPRTMTINYFAKGHIASATFFGSDKGKECLGAIGSHLRQTYGDDSRSRAGRHIWTANSGNVAALGSIPGRYLKPRQAGSNAQASMTDATIIYTAKPDAIERSIFADLGIDAEIIREERELECMIQFAARLSVRDPANAEPLTVNVYDIEQAEWLARYFSTSNYLTIEIIPIDLGFMDYTRPRSRPGPAPTEYTPEEAEARKIAMRETKRLQKQRQRARAAEGLPPQAMGRPRWTPKGGPQSIGGQ